MTVKEKLQKEAKGGKFDKYASAMKEAVLSALEDFAEQDHEFAQAILQGGSFPDCMAHVAKGVKGSSISDFDAFSRAAEFYFPGAKIKFQMKIDLIGDAASGDATQDSSDSIILDLGDFL